MPTLPHEPKTAISPIYSVTAVLAIISKSILATFGTFTRRRSHICLSEQHLAVSGVSTTHMGEHILPLATVSHQHHQSVAVQLEICRLFNSRGGNRCRFPRCKFAHMCSSYKTAGHIAQQCSLSMDLAPVAKRPHS